eukprot:jgi/Ulvmu1/12599/UM092_0029.1
MQGQARSINIKRLYALLSRSVCTGAADLGLSAIYGGNIRRDSVDSFLIPVKFASVSAPAQIFRPSVASCWRHSNEGHDGVTLRKQLDAPESNVRFPEAWRSTTKIHSSPAQEEQEHMLSAIDLLQSLAAYPDAHGFSSVEEHHALFTHRSPQNANRRSRNLFRVAVAYESRHVAGALAWWSISRETCWGGMQSSTDQAATARQVLRVTVYALPIRPLNTSGWVSVLHITRVTTINKTCELTPRGFRTLRFPAIR